MDPITVGLMALKFGGALGGILSKKQGPKSVDPDWIKTHFGADAVNSELHQLFNQAINSSQGQQMLGSAAESGQQFQTDLARQSAAAGLGAGGGATGGADMFASAGAGQAANNLQRGVRSDLMQAMLPIAQQNVQSRLQAYMTGEGRDQATPSQGQQIGALASDTGSQMLSRYDQNKPNANTTTASAPQGTTASPGAGPAPAVPSGQQPTQGAAPMGAIPNQMPQLAANIGAPSMRDVQQQLMSRGTPANRFMSKMSRFSGNMGNAVQSVA